MNGCLLHYYYYIIFPIISSLLHPFKFVALSPVFIAQLIFCGTAIQMKCSFSSSSFRFCFVRAFLPCSIPLYRKCLSAWHLSTWIYWKKQNKQRRYTASNRNGMNGCFTIHFNLMLTLRRVLQFSACQKQESEAERAKEKKHSFYRKKSTLNSMATIFCFFEKKKTLSFNFIKTNERKRSGINEIGKRIKKAIKE